MGADAGSQMTKGTDVGNDGGTGAGMLPNQGEFFFRETFRFVENTARDQ